MMILDEYILNVAAREIQRGTLKTKSTTVVLTYGVPKSYRKGVC